ncbi:D-alanyl-D-alanine dipeptidase [Trichocoleus sp. FACHB-591]|uniref:M15 family metallopeptidase n=1 Tax=Trichocoleus sp. FACHB-591 TaxID=2692872 RepID=UPI001688654D|nr:M15 family metallopeptidase [Trichocoleus sp. FACHB-591]MBD2093716.1 D-alanyl-D-alanine dipeptidase [Trichocoleus sp. FACHB-591]
MKPYQQIAIAECGEPLVPIPLDIFATEHLHAYQKLGAPYGDKSPYYLREQVVARLLQAQQQLQACCPSWRIQVFDAYRPIAVQQYMVDYTFAELVQGQGLQLQELTDAQKQSIWEQVHQFWAVPNVNPATPPPHSTGAAVDVTLVDASGAPVNMGSPIDEISPRSFPDFFADQPEPEAQQHHQNRQLLKQVMTSASFLQHMNEWWHFSWGDQLWAWLSTGANPKPDPHAMTARYGRAEL